MNRTETPALQKAAESILTEAWGGAVTLDTPELLRKPGYRNQIIRFAVAHAPADSPASVIVKTVEETPETPYNPASDAVESPAWRFHNEWAGNLFLNRVAQTPPLNARLYGGSQSSGLLVLEDLGKPNSLADAMQQEEPILLRNALHRYAQSLGKLHAATVGGEADFSQLRQKLCGGAAAPPALRGEAWLRESVQAFREQAALVGVTLSSEWDTEAAQVAAVIDAPGPFLAFSPGDTCPDNHRLMDDGSLRFFDFEFAAFGHALLDAAYLCTPFPTCWCVNRIPDELTGELLQTYRAELVTACPEANDDHVFDFHLSVACAYWNVATLAWIAKDFAMMEKDESWGVATVRQRVPFRLDNFARLAEQTRTFPAMADTARALAATFRALWGTELKEMPFYPAFRDKGQAE